MTKDLNKIQIIGRLGRDPEMRYTQNGVAVTNFSVAVGDQWKDADGERQEKTTWFRCIAWNKLGEVCNEYLRKGSRVYIEGKMESRKYDDRDGVEREVWEIKVQDMIILTERQRDDNGAGDAPQRAPAQKAAPAQQPARGQAPQRGAPSRGPVRNQPQEIDDDDDQIPF